jgi:hypothetical protein
MTITHNKPTIFDQGTLEPHQFKNLTIKNNDSICIFIFLQFYK